MLRFTKRADYGLMAIHYIAVHEDLGAVSAKRIADEFHIPSELLAKILQKLAKKRLITSQNGPKGGYVLARRPAEISVGDVVHIKAGERHWHGAKANTTLSHITITTADAESRR